MSDISRATNSDDSEFHNKVVPEIDKSLKENLLQIPGAIEYIEKLQRTLKKLVKKIRKLKSKISNKEKGLTNAFTQTENENSFTENLDNTKSEEPENEPKSVAQDIKEAAELAMQNMGFVYEETSGMYYDYNTGYYYNAEYGLYYDSKTGTYLNYDAEKKKYEFHSQVPIQPTESEEVNASKKRTRDKTKQKKRANKSDDKVNTSSGLADLTSSLSKMSINNLRHNALEISKQWPPCMRIIVEASDVPSVQIGSLHVITFDGGSLGREGKHSILIPDINISKHHLKFLFNKETKSYNVIDLGSRNGTLLNGKRITPSKQESEPLEITHGSKIQVGSTVLSCHIHSGNHTCRYCEPGLTSVVDEKEVIPKSNRLDLHKKELKKLKKIYGLSRQESDVKLAEGYTDRAQKRREIVGSHNPHEKTQVASLDESISKESKGFKLLSKMGWKEGQSLGKTGEDGLLEPVRLSSNVGGAGLGSTDIVEKPKTTEKTKIWKKTQERFQKLPESNNAFEETSD